MPKNFPGDAIAGKSQQFEEQNRLLGSQFIAPFQPLRICERLLLRQGLGVLGWIQAFHMVSVIKLASRLENRFSVLLFMTAMAGELR